MVNNVLVVIGLLVVGGTIVVGLLNTDSENWTEGSGFFPKGLSGVSKSFKAVINTF